MAKARGQCLARCFYILYWQLFKILHMLYIELGNDEICRHIFFPPTYICAARVVLGFPTTPIYHFLIPGSHWLGPPLCVRTCQCECYKIQKWVVEFYSGQMDDVDLRPTTAEWLKNIRSNITGNNGWFWPNDGRALTQWGRCRVRPFSYLALAPLAEKSDKLVFSKVKKV